jgi:hypothetical protein
VPQIWLELVVQVTPPAQFASVLHATQEPVPFPRYPAAQVGQITLLPLVTLQVSTDAQFAIVPQSTHALLLS